MTDLRTAAKEALEALTNCNSADGHRCIRCDSEVDEGGKVASALRAALAQKDEPVEPVAWLVMDESGYVQHAASWRDAAHEHINDAINEHDLVCARTWRVVPVYTTPSQRLPLTKEQFLYIYNQLPNWGMDMDSLPQGLEKFGRAIERAHGIGEQP